MNTYKPRKTYRRFTKPERDEIIRRYYYGNESPAALAQEFGCEPVTITNLCYRETGRGKIQAQDEATGMSRDVIDAAVAWGLQPGQVVEMYIHYLQHCDGQPLSERRFLNQVTASVLVSGDIAYTSRGIQPVVHLNLEYA